MDPLNELVENLVAGEKPTLAWIVSNSPDGKLNRIWSECDDVSTMARFLEVTGIVLKATVTTLYRIIGDRAFGYGSIHIRKRNGHMVRVYSLSANALRSAYKPKLPTLDVLLERLSL